MNNTNTLREIRDAVYNLLVTQTGDGKLLAGCGKYHPVGPGQYPFASVEPGEVTPSELLSNVEILRPYGFDILVQYVVPNVDQVTAPTMEFAWDKCMDATNAIMDALDSATNLGLAGVNQITPSRPVPGKAVVGQGLTVFYVIKVAIWTVFDKV